VSRYFLYEFNLKRTPWVKFQEHLALIVLPVYMLVMIYYVFLFNLSIGPRATNLWLVVTSLGKIHTIHMIHIIHKIHKIYKIYICRIRMRHKT
jgi:hypothetical protein